ncbi:MAG: transglutaminase-like cysteine peptidase [Alphaproteobacteria bacterium]
MLSGVAALALPGAHSARAAGRPSIFGTREFRSTDLKPFPKWTGALARYFAETAPGKEACGTGAFAACDLRDWQAFLATLDGAARTEAIRAVNREMNRAAYIIDPVNYGMPDYWATPLQFLRRDGDCEDYAITKFMSLRALGFANEAMRIVVLQDLNLRIAHAILVVFDGGRALVLDNQIRDVVAAGAIRHYRPLYSVNETAWWLHRA